MQLNELTHECQWRFRYRPNDPDVHPSLSSSGMVKKTKYVFFKERKWKHLYFNLGFISSIHIISWTCYYKCLSIFANVCPFLHNTVFQYFHLSTRNSPIGIKRSFLSNPLHHLLFCNVILFFVFFLYFSKENNKNKMMQNSLFHILQIHKDFYTFLF